MDLWDKEEKYKIQMEAGYEQDQENCEIICTDSGGCGNCFGGNRKSGKQSHVRGSSGAACCHQLLRDHRR